MTAPHADPFDDEGTAEPAAFFQLEAGTEVGLPEDLLAQAVSRLGIMALIATVLFGVSITSNVILHLARPDVPLVPITVAARVVGILAALFVLYLTRSSSLDRQLICDIGLGFEVVGAAVLVLTEQLTLSEARFPVGAISVVSIWILLFRLIIPSPPARALVASGLSALTVPFSLWLTETAGHATPPEMVQSVLSRSAAVTAIIAWAASRGIYRMGRAVTEARRLGAYKLEDRLASGGMGEVWKASHRLLKRPAAVKLIRPEHLSTLGTDDMQTLERRFEREARATSQLRSVHTVQIFDFGAADDGSFYYVMELLDGIDLETLVQRYGPQPAARTAYLLEQVCHSLGDAHRQGMVHRDVKPANVVLCNLGPDYDFVKVLDFGLVRHQHGDDARLTRDGTAAGSPAYMAPEVALGEEPPGPPADVYGLGCLATWLLTGQLVFEGPTPMAIVNHHINTTPPRPSERTELAVPAELDALVLDCLAKQPTARPRDANEVWRRLRALELAEPWSQDDARRWWDTHRPTASAPRARARP